MNGAGPVTCLHPGSRQAMAAVTEAIRHQLEAAIRASGRGVLAVPGGRTPVALFRVLRDAPIAWKRVVITLTDERRVPAVHEASNARLVARELRCGAAAEARWVGLLPGPDAREIGGVEVRWRARAAPLDVAVLGMGTDGHVASLFPGDPASEAALHPRCTRHVVETRADRGIRARISLTLPALAAAQRLLLLLAGTGKGAVWERVRTEPAAGMLPVGRLAAMAGARLECHHWPEPAETGEGAAG